MDKFVNQMVDNALAMEGTSTVGHLGQTMPSTYLHKFFQGEHGIGIGKKSCLLRELGSETVNTMKTIKAALDPHLLMNPGKIVDF